MSWFGDVGNFELFNLKGMGKQIKDNPARLLYGSADPFSTKVWNKALGRDDKPLVDQWGGAADHRYDDAEEAGINTGPGKTMHGVAKTIAGIFAGGAASGAMGGGAAAAGAGGAAAGGAAAGTGATAAGTTAAGTGAAGGGLLGGTAAAGTAAPAAAGTAAPSTGLLSTFGQYKPAFDAAATGVQMSGLLDPQQQDAPAPVPEQMQGGSQTLATIAAQGAPATVQAGMQERARRRAMMRGGW